ncbi:MAG: phosphoribosyltransferase family protein [Saprospiraceae bacterium]
MKRQKLMQVLDNYQIKQKIVRLSYEILENNLDESAIILAGINNNGLRFAQLLFDTLSEIAPDKKIIISQIKLNPAHPLDFPITTDIDFSSIAESSVIVIDDVANTGRTIFYAFKVFMDVIPKKIEVAVLVDRKHKLFPIKVDYMGLSLATTVQENIKADLLQLNSLSVHLN